MTNRLGPSALVAGVQPNRTGYGYFSASASVPDLCPCANNPSLGYRWMFNGMPLSDGGNISGATGSGSGTVFPALNINPTYYSNAGSYALVITNTCTGQSVTSSAAKLWVTPNPEITGTCYNGLLGLYFTNQTYLVNPFTDPPAWTNVESQPIDFDWSTNKLNSPASKLTVINVPVAACTISNIIGTTLTYGGGAGSKFILLESSDVAAALNIWTRAQTNNATPGSFTISTGGAQKFYRIKSE